jgi:PIN domain nuclease of toxin-antitoxin system
VRLLLDTCTFLWAVGMPHKLSGPAKDVLIASENEVYLSVVSAWEIGVKQALGSLQLTESVDTYIPKYRERQGYAVLPLDESAVLHLTKLPAVHRDPFDRMLVCQAVEHGLTIVTPDEQIRRYPVKVIW